ncbi:MAG: pilus assembly protein N-terminal domain-containing protein [Mesorhizobium sp.]|nr:pilus assembly protein N-terminal domain-containing protein [Mesorhizobium sp.]
MGRSIRRLAAIALSGALLTGLAGTTSALADVGINILMNQAKILRLSRPADTIIIGNPEIADASVQDSSTIVLTGRGFGVTNLVVIDTDGQPLLDEQVIVSRGTANSVRVYRRSDVQTLSCTPFCEGAFRTEAERASDTDMGQPN